MNNSTKATPMIRDETMLLLRLVAANTHINNRATKATNNRLKEQAWQTLTNEFNSLVHSAPRTPTQLRLKWENLKKSARKRANMRSSLNKTGSGKIYIPPNEILDTVTSVLNKTYKGFTENIEEFSGDATSSSDSDLSISEDSVKIEGVVTLDTDENANRQHKLEEEVYKARIFREKAVAEYFVAKKKKLDLECAEKELAIDKLKLELKMAKLENLKLNLKANLSID